MDECTCRFNKLAKYLSVLKCGLLICLRFNHVHKLVMEESKELSKNVSH